MKCLFQLCQKVESQFQRDEQGSLSRPKSLCLTVRTLAACIQLPFSKSANHFPRPFRKASEISNDPHLPRANVKARRPMTRHWSYSHQVSFMAIPSSFLVAPREGPPWPTASGPHHQFSTTFHVHWQQLLMPLYQRIVVLDHVDNASRKLNPNFESSEQIRSCADFDERFSLRVLAPVQTNVKRHALQCFEAL